MSATVLLFASCRTSSTPDASESCLVSLVPSPFQSLSELGTNCELSGPSTTSKYPSPDRSSVQGRTGTVTPVRSSCSWFATPRKFPESSIAARPLATVSPTMAKAWDKAAIKINVTAIATSISTSVKADALRRPRRCRQAETNRCEKQPLMVPLLRLHWSSVSCSLFVVSCSLSVDIGQLTSNSTDLASAVFGT